MKQALKDNSLSLVNRCLYILFMTGLVFSLRAICSISIGLILLTGLMDRPAVLSSSPKRDKLFLVCCGLFFLLQLITLLYTNNLQENWNQLRIKAGIVITPLALYRSAYLNRHTARRLLFDFCLILAVASLYCLIVIIGRYLQSGDGSTFFYHQLVSPLRQHAVYYSIFVFTALVFLMENNPTGYSPGRKVLSVGFIVFFSIFLFLLSSKLVIIFFILYGCYFFARSLKKTGRNKSVGLGMLLLVLLPACLLLTTLNPVQKRFLEIMKGDMAFIRQERYSPAVYFNGLQFRMLQWKLVPEILDENKAWFSGVDANAQDYLDQKYRSKNMYTGDIHRKDKGFLGYNTHNQFLQALLQNGIPGLLVFIVVCVGLLNMLLPLKRAGPVFIGCLLVTYALIESVLETQFGIILFTFLPWLVYFSETKEKPG